jgi:hypothetical protein
MSTTEKLKAAWNQVPTWLPVVIFGVGGVAAVSTTYGQVQDSKQEIKVIKEEIKSDREEFRKDLREIAGDVREAKTDVRWLRESFSKK